MKSRSPVVITGLLFAALALFGFQFFGWRIDGWVLALGGIVHLAIVIWTYPRLDSFLIPFHYLVAFVALAGIGWVLINVVGSAWAAGTGGVLWALLRDAWSKPLNYAIMAGYNLLLTSLFLSLVAIFGWLFHRRKLRCQELLAGLFVSSVLNIPCDFALRDVLSHVVVLDPDASQAFVLAVGIGNLEDPLFLHVVIALIVAVYVWRRRKTEQRRGTV